MSITRLALLLGITSCPNLSLHPQSSVITPPLQEQVAQADRALLLPVGRYRGNITLKNSSKGRSTLDFFLYVRASGEPPERELLYEISSRRRGNEKKLLYLNRGATIWESDRPRNQLVRREEGSRQNPIFSSGFDYINLGFISLEANYEPREIRPRAFKNESTVELWLEPLVKIDHRKIAILLERTASHRPLRIDYHSPAGLLQKTVNFSYGQLLVRRHDEKRSLLRPVAFPIKLEVFDYHNNSHGQFKFIELDQTFRPEPENFKPEYLTR